MYEKRKRIEQVLTLCLDVIMVFISLACAYFLRYRIFFGRFNIFDQDWVLYTVLVTYIAVALVRNWYRDMFKRGVWSELGSVLYQEAVFSAVFLLYMFLMHTSTDFSRLVFGFFIIINTILVLLARTMFKSYMLGIYKTGRYSNRMLVVVPSDNAAEVVARIKDFNEWNRKMVGIVFSDDTHVGYVEKKHYEAVDGIPVVARGSDFIGYVTKNDIDEVFIYDRELENTDTLVEWVSTLETMGIIVNICISEFDIIDSGKKTLNRVGKYATVEYARNIFSFRQSVAKRALDIAGAMCGLLFTALIFPFIAIAIKIDSKGPVIFKQDRVGRNGRIFKFYKFRSMVNDAEAKKKELMEKNEMEGLMFKMEDDPRITKVGRFLRKTSLDEFPQFMNVLKGDMSLVGTRPPTLKEYEQYSAKQKCRLCMTPGITGMWQVSGRSEIKDFDEVVRLDMEYIDDWTIWKDLKILFMTVFVVLFGKGAK